MKYLYNSLFLFMIMLAVVWWGSDSTASDLAGGSNADSSPAAALSQPQVEQSDE
jgi:hypothetical protein